MQLSADAIADDEILMTLSTHFVFPNKMLIQFRLNQSFDLDTLYLDIWF